MNRSLVLIPWLLIGCCDAAQPLPIDATTAVQQQALALEPIVQRFPLVFREQTPDFVCEFPIVNNTARTLRIVGVTQSCGCTTAELDKHDLAAGEVTKLKLCINVRSRSGPHRFHCRLIDDVGSVREYVAEITVCEAGAFAADADLSFGVIDPAVEVKRVVSFDLYAESAAALATGLTFSADTDALTVAAGSGSIETLGSGLFRKRVPVALHLKAGRSAGPHTARVAAQFSRQGALRESHTVVSWAVRSLYEVRPELVFFGQWAGNDQKIERTVLIRRLDGAPLLPAEKIVAFVQAPFRAVVRTGCDPSELQLVVSLDPKEVETTASGILIVTTDDPRQPEIKVPVAVIGRRNP